MTAVEALKKSIEMWTWIRDLRLKTKEEYFQFINDLNPPFCYCYLCEYTKKKAKCWACPVKDWGNGAKYCISKNSVYYSLHDNKFDYSKNQGIPAYEIADQMLGVLEKALQEHLEGKNEADK